jgi:hypothetical protein
MSTGLEHPVNPARLTALPAARRSSTRKRVERNDLAVDLRRVPGDGVMVRLVGRDDAAVFAE